MVAAMRVVPETDNAGAATEGSAAWWAHVTSALRQPFPMEMVGFRPGAKTGKDGDRHVIYAYITASAVRGRLDRVIPGLASWQFRPGPFADSLECIITILGQERTDSGFLKPPSPKEESPETRIKGVYSDAFKRGGRAWGIGDYLEEFPVTVLEMGGSKFLSKQMIGDLQRRYYAWVHSSAVKERFGVVYEEEALHSPTGEMPVDEDVPPPVDVAALVRRFSLDIEDASSAAELRQLSSEIKAAAGMLPDDRLQSLRAAYKARVAAVQGATAAAAPPAPQAGGVSTEAGSSLPVAVTEGSFGPTTASAPPGAVAPGRDPERLCPKCGSVLVAKESKRGAFMSCPGYPGCRYSEDLLPKVTSDTYAMAESSDDLPQPFADDSSSVPVDPPDADVSADPPMAASTANPATASVAAPQSRATWLASEILKASGSQCAPLIAEAQALLGDTSVPQPTRVLLQQLISTRRSDESAVATDGAVDGKLPLDGAPSTMARTERVAEAGPRATAAA